MDKRGVSEVVAFEILKAASQNTHQKLRALAEEVVFTGDVERLPTS